MVKKIGPTPERQALRKTEGTKVEKFVARSLKIRIMDDININIFSHKGVDIRLSNGDTLFFEVKSARRWIPYTYTKDGVRKQGKRAGRFTLKLEDFTGGSDNLIPDIFAFVVKPVTGNLKWDKKKKMGVKYVDIDDVIDNIGEDKVDNLHNTRSKQLQVTLKQVKEMKNFDFSQLEVLEIKERRKMLKVGKSSKEIKKKNNLKVKINTFYKILGEYIKITDDAENLLTGIVESLIEAELNEEKELKEIIELVY